MASSSPDMCGGERNRRAGIVVIASRLLVDSAVNIATTLGIPPLVIGLTVVALLKRASSTSCPWDLAEFGGQAAYVSHWLPGVADGGPGHCFPSGHAVAAFAFFALYFHWRPHQPARARAWLAATLAAGAVFGAAQVVRGAHFASHVLWSAWICWALATTAYAVINLRTAVEPAPAPLSSTLARGWGCLAHSPDE